MIQFLLTFAICCFLVALVKYLDYRDLVSGFKGRCQAKQYGDTMQCACGRIYDTNDPRPPRCPITCRAAPENHADDAARCK